MRNVNKGSAALDKKAGEQGVHTPHTYTHGTRRQDQGTHTHTHTHSIKRQESRVLNLAAHLPGITHSLTLLHTQTRLYSCKQDCDKTILLSFF